MSRRKQAKPRAVKHEGDEDDVDGGTTSTGANSKRTVSGEDTSDSPMADVSDDDREDEEDELEDECDDEGSVSVVVGANRGRSERENSEESVSDQQVAMVKSCGKALEAVAAGPSVCINIDKREDTVEANRVDRTSGHLEGKVQATGTDANKCEPRLQNDSIHSEHLLLAGDPSEVANVSGEEDIDDDEDEVEGDDGTEDDDNDDGDNLDVDDEEDDDDDLPIDGEEDDVDDELTSDSFCSELYSSHTSSSFSPSISDGMATPNSITNDTNDSSLLTLEPGGGSEKSFRQAAGLHHHHHLQHPHHVARHHHHHHVHHRRLAGTTKETGKSSSKNHSASSNNNNNNNSSNHNNNNNHSGNSNSKSLTSTYHCQFCEKTFPRLGYLKKHEQSHTEHMPFKCDYCARLFKHKRSRDRHTKLHTGDRRYRCLHCEAAFSRSDHLKIHMKTHDNQKPFQCTICNRGYNTAAALTSHMQNHKKQLALTGSPNLTYSPRSTTSSLSSGGGSGGGKRAAKFSPYAAGDPLLLLGRTSKQLAKSGGSSSGGSANAANNRTPTPGGVGSGGTGAGPIGAGGPPQDLLSCPYCTRTDFPSLEQLGLHVQSMHGHGALGMLAADTPLPYFPSHLRGAGPGVGRRAVTPDASSLSLGPSYPPIPCDFCTMKFPTVPLMFAHLKASHFDRLTGGAGRGVPSDGGGSPSGTVGPSRPPSGYHPLDQLHFNKSILGSTFSSFYGAPFGGGGAATSSAGGGSIKVERRSAGLLGRDENGNEPEEPTVKRRRRAEDDNRVENYNDDETKVAASLANENEDVMGEEDDVVGGNHNAQETVGHYEDEDEDEDDVNAQENEEGRPIGASESETRGRVKQESHDAMSHTSSARSSPCESVASSTHLLPGHTSGGECSPAEQLTPTDLSQPKMKRLKLEALDDDGEEGEERRSQSREVHHRGKRDGHNRRESESKEYPDSLRGPPSLLSSLHHSHNNHHHHHLSSVVTSSTTQSTGTSQHAQVSQAPSMPPTGAAAASLPPGAYLCNQCNAALPDFESFRTHLKAHLEQSAAAAMRLSGVDASVVGNGGSGSVAPHGALSLSAFLCQQCGATLSCQAEYEQHTIGHYLVTAVEYRCQAAGSSSACATGKTATFGKVEDLHKHLYEGHMQLLYKCTVCGETFETKVQVQVHFAVNHSVEVKLYRCSACAEVCRTERDFRQHIRNRHLAAGAVQCMFCRMVCSSELEMHFHLASHARKFKCPACPESFHVEFLLDRHIQTQHSQKETGSEANRRECTSGNSQPVLGSSVTSSAANSTANGPAVPSSTNVVSSSATVTSTASTSHSSSAGSSLEYLQLQGQMAAMAAAAAAASTGWPSLYQTANKFYVNPLHVDTLSQLKHPQHLLHGFYDTMQQQNRTNFISEPTASGSGSKKNPFVGDIPSGSSKVANTMLGLGYGGTTGTAQPQRPVNGTSSGLYSPESATTNPPTTANPGNPTSSKLYSPIAMIQRYGENGPLVSAGAERVGPTASAVESPTTATGPSMLSHPTIGGLSGQHPPEQAGRKPNAPSSTGGKHSERPSGGPGGVASSASSGPQSTPGTSNCCYSCGICERTDFSTESEVQTHRKIVHNLKTGVSLRCAYCNGDFRSRNELENHMKIAHNTGGGKHKCLICDEIFPSPAVLAEHKLSHCKVGASGRCSHCSLPLPDVQTFKQHLPAHQTPASSSGATTSDRGSSASSTAGTTNSAGPAATNLGSSGASSSAAATANANGTGAGNTSGGTTEQERFPQQCICCRQTLNSEFEISLHAKFHTKSPDTNERTCALCLDPLPSQPESSTKICDPCLKRHNFPSKLLSMNFLKPPHQSGANSTAPSDGHSVQLGSLPSSNVHGFGSNGASSHGQAVGETRLPSREKHVPFEQGGIPAEGPPGASIVQCNLCKKSLTSTQKLQEHLIDHTFAGCEERGYVCYLCSAVFTSSAGLQTHLPLAHSNTTAKPYDCERCGVAYFFRAELEHHLIDHELGAAGPVTQRGCDEWPRSASGDDYSSLRAGGDIKQEHSEDEQERSLPPSDTPPTFAEEEDGTHKDEDPSTVERSHGEERHLNDPAEGERDEGDANTEANKNDPTMLEERTETDGERTGGRTQLTEESQDSEENDPEREDEEEVEEDDDDDDDEDDDEEEEYIEVEHTTVDDRGKGCSPKLLVNGEQEECIGMVAVAASASANLPAVTAAE